MRRTRLTLAGLLLAAVAAGGAANAIDANFLASGWDPQVHGEEGVETQVGNFRVRVGGASASTTLDGGEVSTPASFVVVRLAYATTDAWNTPDKVSLVDGSGRTFLTADGFGSDGQAWAAGPDIWFAGTLLFEVPPEAIDDLTLEFRPQTLDGRLPETALQIPLTVQSSAEPLELERATLVAEDQNTVTEDENPATEDER